MKYPLNPNMAPFPSPFVCWGWYIDTVGSAFCSGASHNLWWRWLGGSDYLPQKVQISRPPIGVAFPLQGNVKMPTNQRAYFIGIPEGMVSQTWNVGIWESTGPFCKSTGPFWKFCKTSKIWNGVFAHPKSVFSHPKSVFFGGDFFEDLSCCVQINGGNRTGVRVPENILVPSLTICDIEIRCRKKRTLEMLLPHISRIAGLDYLAYHWTTKLHLMRLKRGFTVATWLVGCQLDGKTPVVQSGVVFWDFSDGNETCGSSAQWTLDKSGARWGIGPGV